MSPNSMQAAMQQQMQLLSMNFMTPFGFPATEWAQMAAAYPDQMAMYANPYIQHMMIFAQAQAHAQAQIHQQQLQHQQQQQQQQQQQHLQQQQQQQRLYQQQQADAQTASPYMTGYQDPAMNIPLHALSDHQFRQQHLQQEQRRNELIQQAQQAQRDQAAAAVLQQQHQRQRQQQAMLLQQQAQYQSTLGFAPPPGISQPQFNVSSNPPGVSINGGVTNAAHADPVAALPMDTEASFQCEETQSPLSDPLVAANEHVQDMPGQALPPAVGSHGAAAVKALSNASTAARSPNTDVTVETLSQGHAMPSPVHHGANGIAAPIVMQPPAVGVNGHHGTRQ